MILYQVNATVKKENVSEWRDWMCAHHIPEVMQTGYFLHVRMLESIDEGNEGTFIIEYICESKEKLSEYRQEVSPALQRSHNEKFGDCVSSFRNEYTLIFELP